MKRVDAIVCDGMDLSGKLLRFSFPQELNSTAYNFIFFKSNGLSVFSEEEEEENTTPQLTAEVLPVSFYLLKSNSNETSTYESEDGGVTLLSDLASDSKYSLGLYTSGGASGNAQVNFCTYDDSSSLVNTITVAQYENYELVSSVENLILPDNIGSVVLNQPTQPVFSIYAGIKLFYDLDESSELCMECTGTLTESGDTSTLGITSNDGNIQSIITFLQLSQGSFNNITDVTMVGTMFGSFTNIADFFRGGTSTVKTFDGSRLNTEFVNGFESAFKLNTALEEVDLSGWVMNTSSLSEMFYSCTNLKKVKLDNVMVQGVIRMENIFRDCSSLTELRIDTFEIMGVNISFRGMFNNCTSLRRIYCNQDWTTLAQSLGDDMFANCTSLEHYSPSNIGVYMATPNNGYFTSMVNKLLYMGNICDKVFFNGKPVFTLFYDGQMIFDIDTLDVTFNITDSTITDTSVTEVEYILYNLYRTDILEKPNIEDESSTDNSSGVKIPKRIKAVGTTSPTGFSGSVVVKIPLDILNSNSMCLLPDKAFTFMVDTTVSYIYDSYVYLGSVGVTVNGSIVSRLDNMYDSYSQSYTNIIKETYTEQYSSVISNRKLNFDYLMLRLSDDVTIYGGSNVVIDINITGLEKSQNKYATLTPNVPPILGNLNLS